MAASGSNYPEWIKRAEDDLLNIANNLQAANIPWSTVCFHAQQAAEKFLKGYILFKGGVISKTHDLVYLLSLSRAHDPTLAILQNDCLLLNPHSIDPRYPVGPLPNEADIRQLVLSAQNVRTEILKRLH